MIKVIILLLVSFLSTSCVWNNNASIISRGDYEFQSVLIPGTSKEQIINFLKEKKYYYSEINETTSSYYTRDGKCRRFSDGKFKWNCQYYGYIFTRRDAGFLSITDPSLRVYLFIDRTGKLLEHHMKVGHTFL
ncbi:hypothetical protein Q4575_19735 [Psychrosphaera sp. 1_MG-2023]|uniref:hypothetical protein n=1 Tax=Psychrosphaera sp. 1_MG-2023 TaxID=3062643 RepID=UPI0026E398E7|nr:hypothetical protein [Psychrosphaera sp. 1_MG-2023]MDO6721632.1 hypothetical protein [Psychrosphaera sp. 1_MG-2023]